MRKIVISVITMLVMVLGTSSAQEVCEEFRVNTYTANSQYAPSVAMDATGNSVIVWRSRGQDGTFYGVYGQMFDPNGNPRGGEFRVSPYGYTASSASTYYPSVAINDSGSFVVVWDGEGPEGKGIYAQMYDKYGDQQGVPIRVDSLPMSAQSYGSVGIDNDGNFVVIWHSWNPDTSWDVYGRRFDKLGNPLGTEFKINTYTERDQMWATVAMNRQGYFVITWMSDGQDESGWGIYARIYDNTGTPLGDEFRVNSYTDGSQLWSYPGLTDDGDVVITWSDNGRDVDVYAQRFDLYGNRIDAEFRVNTYTLGFQSSPVVAINRSGSFVIAWDSGFGQDGDGYGVFAQLFDSNGNPVGSEFQVNCHTIGHQHVPVVAMDNSGNFIATWADDNRDGSGYGIFARRFEVKKQVVIDIKPGSFPNSINLNSNGLTPVAVLSGTNFDATTIDSETVMFAGTQPIRDAIEDVNGDQRDDMMFFFNTRELSLSPDSTNATISGKTTNGVSFTGADSVRIVTSKR